MGNFYSNDNPLHLRGIVAKDLSDKTEAPAISPPNATEMSRRQKTPEYAKIKK